jgi:glucose uptake protein GlcU
MQSAILPADSVRSLAAPGISVAARRSSGSDVLGQSSCEVLALEQWVPWRQFSGGPGMAVIKQNRQLFYGF